MRENFLYYIWKHYPFGNDQLQLTDGRRLTILKLGNQNTDAGPDFLGARIEINEQRWAGDIEMHLLSSDWNKHAHNCDDSYNSVILHVVWEHDTGVKRSDQTWVPTLELKPLIPQKLIMDYDELSQLPGKSINCRNLIEQVDEILLSNWFEKLYLKRLRLKSARFEDMLIRTNFDWERILFFSLARNFGLKINADAFQSIAGSVDYGIFRKLFQSLPDLEALLFGQSGLLIEKGDADNYTKNLMARYQFLKSKFRINGITEIKPKFLRLRPSSFPTIRLAQLAALLNSNSNLFQDMVSINDKDMLRKILRVNPSAYWTNHYTFGKLSRPKNKQISNALADLLILNVVLPIRYSYALYLGKENISEIINLAQEIEAETNSVTSIFSHLGIAPVNALQSQGQIHLKTNFCDRFKCLDCDIGNAILGRNM